ncbi:hypothetical protein M422DRAFT_773932 [Sphaerobolus stellatus SS14]|nr:hypothetical protein M422DRAFT_773932 [Sphaerobolus stellatus SS14]
MEQFAIPMSMLPDWDLLMMVNLQVFEPLQNLFNVDHWAHMCDVTRKFQRSKKFSPDLIVSASAKREVSSNRIATRMKEDVIYARLRSYGFRRSNSDTVSCGHALSYLKLQNPFHEDFSGILKMYANKLMCLAKYIFHDDSFRVHATYVTLKHPLPSSFLAARDPTPSISSSGPPIIHVYENDFIPSLMESKLSKTDNVLSRSPKLKNNMPPKSLRKIVKQTGEPFKSTTPIMQRKTPRECANCRKSSREGMKHCARCQLTYYCSTSCQKEAWKHYKLLCEKATANTEDDHLDELLMSTTSRCTPPLLTYPKETAVSSWRTYRKKDILRLYYHRNPFMPIVRALSEAQGRVTETAGNEFRRRLLQIKHVVPATGCLEAVYL